MAGKRRLSELRALDGNEPRSLSVEGGRVGAWRPFRRNKGRRSPAGAGRSYRSRACASGCGAAADGGDLSGEDFSSVVGEFFNFFWESLEKINSMQKKINRVESLVVAMLVLLCVAVTAVFAILLGLGCRQRRRHALPRKALLPPSPSGPRGRPRRGGQGCSRGSPSRSEPLHSPLPFPSELLPPSSDLYAINFSADSLYSRSTTHAAHQSRSQSLVSSKPELLALDVEGMSEKSRLSEPPSLPPTTLLSSKLYTIWKKHLQS